MKEMMDEMIIYVKKKYIYICNVCEVYFYLY